MKKLFYIILIGLPVLFNGCTKQSIELEVIEKACRNFKISEPSYVRISETCSGATTASFEVTFKFNNSDKDCIHLIENQPTFYDEFDNEISNVTFKDQILKSDAEVTEGTGTITYLFEVEFANASDADDFNHMVLKFHTENENEDESNALEIRLNLSCTVVNSTSYNVNPETVNVPATSFFTITLWDNAAEDGDIVSVYLNGTWIIENHTLTNAGTNFNVPTSMLNSGANDLVVFALNEGSSGPNTVSISINGEEIDNFSPGLLTGEAVQINF